MSISISRPYIKLLAGTAAAALLIGWAAGVGAQTTLPSLPPIPQAKQQPAGRLAVGQRAAANLPAVPLGHDDVREVQNQLIALGFDPGAADGQIGPATNAAAQQYDQSRGGNGQVAIDGALLGRLKADKASRLTYEQVAGAVAGPPAGVGAGSGVEPVRQHRAADRAADRRCDQQQQQQQRLLRPGPRLLRPRSRLLRSAARLLLRPSSSADMQRPASRRDAGLQSSESDRNF